MANALQIKNMITGDRVYIPGLLLEKYPVLGEIVRRIRAGQQDLFPGDGSRAGNRGGGDKT